MLQTFSNFTSDMLLFFLITQIKEYTLFLWPICMLQAAAAEIKVHLAVGERGHPCQAIT